MKSSSLFTRTDNVLTFLVLVACSLGVLLLYSAQHQSFTLALRQVLKGSIAVIFFIFLSKMDDRSIRSYSIPIYIFSVMMLLFVLFSGYATKGAQRWLDLGLFKFEPSELIKVTLPLALAAFIHNTGIPVRGKPLLFLLGMIALPFFLIIKQPDLGTGIIVTVLGAITLFVSGLNRNLIIASCSLLLISAPLLWHTLHPYQQQRVMTLLSPEDDIQHHGYHVYQSKVAIGSGQFWGKGIGNGTQVQLGYIPEHRTDFIFTLLSEELGFIGNLLWITLVQLIGFRCIYLGHKQSSCYNKLVCITMGCNFMLNAWINMSMVSGLLPVVGIPLPLISYGGTSFAVSLISFALVLKLGHTDPKRQYTW